MKVLRMSTSVKKYLKVLLNLAIALVVVLLCVIALPKLLVFFMPFVLGYLIALIASPLVRFFEEKLKIKRKAGTAFVIIAVIALVVLGIYLVGAKLTREAVSLVEELPEMWGNLEGEINAVGDKFEVLCKKLPKDFQEALSNITGTLSGYVGKILGSIGTPTITAVGNFAKNLPAVLIGVIMCLLSAYFFVAERTTLSDVIGQYVPQSIQKRYSMMKRSLGHAVGGYLKAQLKIEIWMYLLLSIGLAVLHINHVLIIALGIAFLDLLPFFGTGTVLVPWAIVKFLSGDYTVAVGLLIIWGVGQLARQLIQPKIVGDSIGVPPLPTLFLLFVGFKVAGVIGMILAVPIGIIIYTMYQEGAFDTTVNSLKILVSGVNRFRRLTDEDMKNINPHKPQVEKEEQSCK